MLGKRYVKPAMASRKLRTYNQRMQKQRIPAMRLFLTIAGMVIVTAQAAAAWPLSVPPARPEASTILVRGATCKSVNSCRDAVELWCSGYSRADGDGDGIPCETVCHGRQTVREIQREIGCE